ncbi:MAG: endonuclease III [Candidatus Aenigmarchaeota archaeon]|nr:endonuclease III [Candidatus Aenigmarchaeota archaeon]
MVLLDNHKHIEIIISRLRKQYPGAKTELLHKNPLELLIATVLSAQATDKSVNKVTPILFSKYKYTNDFADADFSELQEDIKTINFYKTKAKNIKKICTILEIEFRGMVPNTMDELVRLPGVARKTANVVLTEGYGIIDGIAVDTHVTRLSERLGLTENTDPKKIEKDLMNIANKNDWRDISNLLILHGRAVCSAKKPNCKDCLLNDICKSAFKA